MLPRVGAGLHTCGRVCARSPCGPLSARSPFGPLIWTRGAVLPRRKVEVSTPKNQKTAYFIDDVNWAHKVLSALQLDVLSGKTQNVSNGNTVNVLVNPGL